MFAEVNAVIGGCPAAQGAILKDVICKGGGNAVVAVPVASIFSGAGAPPICENVSHLIVGNKAHGPWTESALCRALGLSLLPKDRPLLNCSWISDSRAAGYILSTDKYEILLPKAPADVTCGDAVLVSKKRDRPIDGEVEEKENGTEKDSSGQNKRVALPSGESGRWETICSGGKTCALYKLNGGLCAFNGIVAFDLDGTIIKTKSGKAFGETKNDWIFFSPNVPAVLKSLYESGKYVAIISNQNGVGKCHGLSLEDLKHKLDSILSKLQCPVDVFCAFEKDQYRKPRTEGWMWLLGRRVIDFSSLPSVYVGDAAGRPKRGHVKKDFSASDLKFAMNCGATVRITFQCLLFYFVFGNIPLQFATPEAHFLGSVDPANCVFSEDNYGFSWRNYCEVCVAATILFINIEYLLHCFYKKRIRSSNPAVIDSSIIQSSPVRPEIILLVGPPASGKSTFCRTKLSSHTWVNQDTLKTKARCLSYAEEALQSGNSVVVDSTNPTVESRRDWVSLSRQKNVEVCCVHYQSNA
jgi:bifunctional polynucleotide phosphatase/kinase